MHNELFDRCLAKVDPETRQEVRRNMEKELFTSIKTLLKQAWENLLDAYEQNPRKYEGLLIVEVSKDLKEAVIYEQEMVHFIDRNKNYVFRVDFEDGKPSNFDDIARQIYSSTI